MRAWLFPRTNGRSPWVRGKAAFTLSAWQVLRRLKRSRDGDERRDVWVLEAKKNRTHGELKKASMALIRGGQKLVYYNGYKHYQDKYEFYDLENDPEELENQYKSIPIAKEMKAELDQKFEIVKKPIT